MQVESDRFPVRSRELEVLALLANGMRKPTVETERLPDAESDCQRR